MNPFAWPGSEFLAFYIVLTALVGGFVVLVRRQLGPTGMPSKRLTDPYSIALVRGGIAEAIRVGVMSLTRRNYLSCIGRNAQVTDVAATVKIDAEQAILHACQLPIPGYDLLSNVRVAHSFQARVAQLEDAGLIPDANLRTLQVTLVVVGALILGLTGAIKIISALLHGHHNVVFLMFSVGLAAVVMWWCFMSIPQTTPRGHQLLAEMRSLFHSLRGHPVAGRPDEALFLAAIYGASALPVADQRVMRDTFEPPQQLQSSGSSCGTSSTSSCGSSGGSSCGGGGCGGCGSS